MEEVDKSWQPGSFARVVRLAAILLLALPALIYGQRYSFKLYTRAQGLGNLTTLTMQQDSTGYLWVGTQHGLFRYDGAHFLTFDVEQGLPSPRIESLYETQDGVLWVGTSAGLARRVGMRFVAVDVGRPIEMIGRSGIISDSQGQLYVSSLAGLFIGRPSAGGYRFTPVPATPGTDDKVYGTHVAPDGVVWYGCGTAICRLDAGHVTKLDGEHGIPPDRWDAMVTDPEGTLWIRSSTRLLRRVRGASRFEPEGTDIPDNSDFASLSLGRNGELLVPTDFGVMIRAGGTWRCIGKDRGLPSQTTSSVLVDREGSIWIGLRGGGAARWIGYQQWESWNAADGLSSDTIWAMRRDQAGDLWAGSDLGINRMHIGADGKPQWRSWTERDGVNGNKVRSVATAQDGSIWTGSSPGGITKLDPRTGVVARYGEADGITNDRITALKLDGRGGVWVGTRGGIFHGSKNGRSLRFQRVELPHSDPNEILYDGVADNQGAWWLCGNRGLVRMVRGKWRRVTTKDGLATDNLAYI